MSSRTYTYIGVYLVVDEHTSIDRTRRECERGHKQMSTHATPQFCSECGSRFGTIEFVENRRMAAYDAAEKYGFPEDTFNNVDRGDKPCIWLGNDTVDSLTNGEQYEGEFEINEATILAAVLDFQSKYQVQLDLLDANDVDYVMHFGTVLHRC